jgi:hypothetical protein
VRLRFSVKHAADRELIFGERFRFDAGVYETLCSGIVAQVTARSTTADDVDWAVVEAEAAKHIDEWIEEALRECATCDADLQDKCRADAAAERETPLGEQIDGGEEEES